MRIIVVDDDNIESESLKTGLRDKLNAEVQIIHTESEFVAKFEEIASRPPDFIVLDVMLRWTDPGPDIDINDVPEKVLRDGFFTAGVRCLERLKAEPRTKDIPVVFYTTLKRNEFGLPVTHITKAEEIDALAQNIRAELAS